MRFSGLFVSFGLLVSSLFVTAQVDINVSELNQIFSSDNDLFQHALVPFWEFGTKPNRESWKIYKSQAKNRNQKQFRTNHAILGQVQDLSKNYLTRVFHQHFRHPQEPFPLPMSYILEIDTQILLVLLKSATVHQVKTFFIEQEKQGHDLFEMLQKESIDDRALMKDTETFKNFKPDPQLLYGMAKKGVFGVDLALKGNIFNALTEQQVARQLTKEVKDYHAINAINGNGDPFAKLKPYFIDGGSSSRS